MSIEVSQPDRKGPWGLFLRTRDALAPRACSAILLGTLFYNLAVKLFHALRYGQILHYPMWILTDVGVLLTIEVVLSLICFRWPTRRVVRGAMIFAAILCTWSVINAGWLIRTGTQILPMELRPILREPVSILLMVVHNMWGMPLASAVLLIPSAIALTFFFSILARPQIPRYDPRRLRSRVATLLAVSLAAALGNLAVVWFGPARLEAGLRFNCQSRAVLSFLLPEYRHLARNDFDNATRTLPRHDQVKVALKPRWVNHNVVIVVLEGVQYDCTSLARTGGIAPQGGDGPNGPTPCLAALADQGVSFTNTRSVITHTTKALFALLTGRVPSASQDTAETVPVDTPYASLATILKQGLGFRTAFFQSAMGSFEGRPGLVHNLGFDKFWSREDLNDPNRFLGYLGSDEFAMLGPVTDWIKSDDKPFLLVTLCSVTHDPYDLPPWYGPRADDLIGRYRATIAYTDRFIGALDTELARLGLGDDTIFCVVGDHGEAFGEHGISGHERLAYEEVLRVAMCMRAPYLIEPGTRVTGPVTSMDLTPTILGVLGFDIDAMGFDGVNALDPLPKDRRTYFSGWMQQGPGGFVQGNRKYVYDPAHGGVSLYRLDADPLELTDTDLPPEEAQQLTREIGDWRRGTIFRIDQTDAGTTTLFDSWHCKWSRRNRDCTVRRIEPSQSDAAPSAAKAVRRIRQAIHSIGWSLPRRASK